MPRCAFQKGLAQWLGKVNYLSDSVTTAVLMLSVPKRWGRWERVWGVTGGDRERGSQVFFVFNAGIFTP